MKMDLSLLIFTAIFGITQSASCKKSYICARTCYKQEKYNTCWFGRCTRYRKKSYTCYGTCYRCCPGWTSSSSGVCSKPICFESLTCPNNGTCLKPNDCACQTGFQKPRCNDIDECLSRRCDHICTNTHGSFFCTCRDGYELQPDGRTCKRLCRWDNYYCWPGVCSNSLTEKCSCASGFHRTTGSAWSETTCQLNTANSPSIETCDTRVRGPHGEMKRAMTTTASTACRYLTDMYGNFQPQYLIYDMLAEFTVDIGSYSKPKYIHDFRFGVTDTSLSVSVLPVSGSDTRTKKHNMFVGKTDSSDATRTRTDNFTLAILTTVQQLTDGQWLCTTFDAKGGGFLRSIDYTQANHVPSPYVPYSKTKTTRRICYRFDSSKPEHCKQTRTCNDEPLKINEIITASDIIYTYFQGWNDPIPDKGNLSHASGIESYEINVHEVIASKGNLKVDTGIVYTEMTNSVTSSISFNVTSDKPKLYAIYLEVKDFADNVRVSRRFVLFDKWSKIEIRKGTVFYVESASILTNYIWQSNNSDICLNWTDYFYNTFYLENPYLNQIEPDPSGLITGVYEQQSGLLPVSGTLNVNGIVKFMFSWFRKNETLSPEIEVPHFPRQWYCHNFSADNGETYTFNLKAIDIAGHTLTDNRTVHIDWSVPQINNIFLVADDVSRLFVHNRSDLSRMQFSFDALDPHSGIREILWTFGASDSGDLTTGNVSVETLKQKQCSIQSSDDHKCYCPDVGTCEMYSYTLPIANLISTDRYTRRGANNQTYYLTINVTNHAMLSNIEHIDILVKDSSTENGMIHEGCQLYFVGLNCSGKSKYWEPCKPMNDTCVYGCVDGSYGEQCTVKAKESRQNPSTMVWPVVGGTLAIILCLAIVIVLLILYLRRRTNQRSAEAKTKSTNYDHILTHSNPTYTSPETHVYDTLEGNDSNEMSDSHIYANEVIETVLF